MDDKASDVMATGNLTSTPNHGHDNLQVDAMDTLPRADSHAEADERVQNRADLALIYAGVLGISVTRKDLVEVLRFQSMSSSDGQSQGAGMVAALASLGLDASLTQVDDLHPDQWPALACMTSGQVILVLGQDADQLVIYDTSCADNQAYVPKSDFSPFFSGFLVRAEYGATKTDEVEDSSFKPDRIKAEVTRFFPASVKFSLKSWAIILLVVVATIIAIVTGSLWMVVGGFVLVAIIALGVSARREQLIGKLLEWRQAKTATDVLSPLPDTLQDLQNDPSDVRHRSFEGRIEVRNLSYYSDTNEHATLDIPALDIEAGQKIALLGANGAGTSTLLNALSGSRAPLVGHVLIDGIEMWQIDRKELQGLIGYLGNDVRIVTGSLRDNLNLDLVDQDEERLCDALAFAGLSPFVRSHPKGLDLPIFNAGRDLTKSQRQSIGWARLWLQNPKICVLDEPTAGLEQLLEATLVDRLSRWLEGRTAIIATERKSLVALTDRMLVLQHGQVAFDGPKDQVLAQLWGAEAEPIQTAIAS
ncbi:MAG: ATP-binding cassette domain-containing protein [Paracoccaceae bacterium]